MGRAWLDRSVAPETGAVGPNYTVIPGARERVL